MAGRTQVINSQSLQMVEGFRRIATIDFDSGADCGHPVAIDHRVQRKPFGQLVGHSSCSGNIVPHHNSKRTAKSACALALVAAAHAAGLLPKAWIEATSRDQLNQANFGH